MLLRKKLDQGKSVVGTMLNIVYNPDIMRILAGVGLDYVIVDCEHASYTFRELNNLIAVAKGAGISVLVRIPQVDRAYIQRCLDIGAEGFMIPNTNNPKMMEDAVRFARYIPLGERGVGGGIVTDFKSVDWPEWIKEQSHDAVIMAQIESSAAVDTIDNILGVKGVDAVIFGPRDLSCNLGIIGQIKDPRMFECYEKVFASAERNSVIKGFFVGGDPMDLRWATERGAKLLLWSGDTLAIQTHYKNGLQAIKNDPNFVQ